METRRSVVVTNLPDFKKETLKDKLEIHFGRRGNGGGDVAQIVITKQHLIGTLALIKFAEKETAASVLGKQHIFFGKTLTVEPHSSTEEGQRNTGHTTPPKVRLANLPQLPSQDLKLIIQGRYADDVLESTAVLTNATLQVDEKSTKFYLKGPPATIVQAVDILGKHNTKTKTQPHELGNVGQRNNKANWATSIFSLGEKHSDADSPKIVQNGTTTRPGSPRKDVPKMIRKRKECLANNKKLSRNIAKFDPKILGYIQAVEHRVMTEAGDRFYVNFEAKANGVVEFKSRGQKTDQQRIDESIQFLENLVDDIQKMGFVTKIVSLMQFQEAPKQKVDEAVQQTLKSTDVLVSLRASKTLEFYGPEHIVHQEIEKLRAGILGRELQTDSQGDDEQTVYNQLNGDGTQRPHEELGSMAGRSKAKNYSEHPERLASLDDDIADGTSSAQGVQFKKSVYSPSRKPLVRPLVTPEGSTAMEGVQFSFAENLVDGESYRSPEGPPTWKGESYPSLCSVTYNELCYPPDEAKEENQASEQSWQSADLAAYFSDDSLPDEQKKNSDLDSEQEVETEGSTAMESVQFSFAENSVVGESYRSPEGPPTWKGESYPSLCSVTYNELCYPPDETKEENQASEQSWQSADLAAYFSDDSLPDEQKKNSDLDSEQEVETAKPKVTFVYMNQGAHSPPKQHSRLQGATQNEDEEQVSRSRQNDESTKLVEMSLDEVDGAGALFMANGSAMSARLDMEPSPSCVPSKGNPRARVSPMKALFMANGSAMSARSDMEPSPSCVPSKGNSRARVSPMEVDHIFPVKTSAVVPFPYPSLVSSPSVDLSLGGASPGGFSTGGIPGLYDTATQSRDFIVTIRTGMKVIIRQGDITDEFTDVIVTSADPRLQLKDGVGRAVREAAGHELVGACQRWITKNGPVDHGKNVWTVGGNLKCSHVLHVVLRQSQGGMSHKTELKEMFMDLLKTCVHSLQASHVSMPAIGVEKMAMPKKVWARAFFEAVCEITQLYDRGWMQLSTLVLVDRNGDLIREVKRVFQDPILSGSFEESSQNVRQESPYSGFSTVFIGSDALDRPRLRARGPSGVRKGAPKRGSSNTQSANWLSAYQTPVKKDNNRGVKSAFIDDLPVDPDHKCAICLLRINQEKKLRCKHSFCRQCVDAALKVHDYCPICRQPAG